ncbi:DNA internalization-related competence protein ComEC/Rec2 [Thiovibrio frasassiensis]|uniref:DNA internalization-related competence protein ComEC/Rec2 n=1 Tax=Thiovibrio frasassiensis TaxID=2984131 RepID=A0A9X4MPI6_9BACT|nr:DNA internalization-related competence protein ComEC/Rec2 [Thiovibrio frasassiensis]MDG4476537.1 DNA internalization-related competence protein ComEC/Rec2 [Thiovibrio frasassiensis]
MLPQTDRNPLLPLLLPFAAGAMAAGGDWLTTTAFLWWSALLSTSLAVLALLRQRQPRLLLPALFPPLFFLCGLLYTQSFLNPNLPPHHLVRLMSEQQEMSLTGKLIEKPIFRHEKTQIILETDSALLPTSEAPIATTGRATLTINAPLLKGLVPGQDYLVRARLSLPEKPATPGVFDYAGYLAAKEIMVKGWVASPIFIQPISPRAERRFPLLSPYFLERFRQQFAAFLYANLTPNTAALYQALLLGDSSTLSPEVLEMYRATGIMHLLAISGSHLAVVAFLSTLFFRFLAGRFPWLLLRLPAAKIALACSFPVLLLYAGLAGFHPPVVRALIMIGVFMTAMLLDRQWSSLNNLAIAAFCILLYNPLSIHTASFQLTFAATAAIILTLPRLAAWHPQPDRHSARQRMQHLIISGLFISSAAFLATAPLALFHFNRISMLGPITTLLSTPLLCFWTLPLGLIAILIQPLSSTIALLLLQLGGLGIQGSHALTGLLAGLPFSSFWLPTPTIPMLIGAYALLLLLFRTNRPLSILSLLACFALLLSGHTPLPQWQNNSSHLTFLAVGNGSATVVEQPDNRVILIDGGGPPDDLFNVGERVIAPFLWHRQIKRVEAIILTHPHADHFNGLPFIIKRFQPEVLWLSETTAQEPGYSAVLREAAQSGCQIRIARPNQVLAVGKNDFALTCLANLALAGKHEPIGDEKKSTANPNNRGLVLRLDYGHSTFLFPGDIEKDYEEYILDKEELLKADVLLMPHHGLRSSGSARFMENVSPRYCVVSTGRKVPFPPPQVSGSGTEIFSTAHHGTVFFHTDGKTITAQPYRPTNGSEKGVAAN